MMMKPKAKVCLRCGKVSSVDKMHICADYAKYIKYLGIYVPFPEMTDLEENDESGKAEDRVSDNR